MDGLSQVRCLQRKVGEDGCSCAPNCSDRNKALECGSEGLRVLVAQMGDYNLLVTTVHPWMDLFLDIFYFFFVVQKMSESPTTTTSQKSTAIHLICIAIRLPFVSQYFRCPYTLRAGRHCQYSSHLYRSAPPICIAIRLPLWSPGCSPVVAGVINKNVSASSDQLISDTP